MIAVDTNVIVRLIVGDDEAQVARALALAARETLFVSFTVLVETEWVLRSRYGYARSDIVAALLNFDLLVDMRLEDRVDVRWALERYALAGELADYLHIAAARAIGRFASFEKRLAGRAGDDPPAKIEMP